MKIAVGLGLPFANSSSSRAGYRKLDWWLKLRVTHCQQSVVQCRLQPNREDRSLLLLLLEEAVIFATHPHYQPISYNTVFRMCSLCYGYSLVSLLDGLVRRVTSALP